MNQKKLPLINSAHGSDTRNIINELIKLFNGMGYTYDEALQKAHNVLNEAQQTNDMNVDVQQQLDTLIAESGTSDAEVLQARIDSEGNEYDVLKTRLDEKEQNFNTQLAQTGNATREVDFYDILATNNYENVGITKNTETEIELFAQNDRKGTRYVLTKDPNDEFLKLGAGSLYDCVSSETITTKGDGWVTTSTVNHFTETIGDFFSFSFFGTGFTIPYYTNNQGGMMSVRVDGKGVLDFSTFSTEASESETYVKTELGYHTVEVIFTGSDPLNPLTKPRGWARALEGSITTYGTMERNNIIDLLHPVSNKEMAFSIRYNDDSFWFPEHNNVGTMFNGQLFVHVDNEQISFTGLSIGEVVSGKTITVQQLVDGYESTQTTKLANIRMGYTMGSKGVIKYKGSMRCLVPFEVVTGYPLMLPVNSDRLNRVVTSFNNTAFNSGDSTELYFNDEEDKATSVMFTTNISGNGSYVAFAKIDTPHTTMRFGENNKPPLKESLFFWQRPTVPKFYFTSMSLKPFETNEEYKWSGTIGVGISEGIASFM